MLVDNLSYTSSFVPGSCFNKSPYDHVIWKKISRIIVGELYTISVLLTFNALELLVMRSVHSKFVIFLSRPSFLLLFLGILSTFFPFFTTSTGLNILISYMTVHMNVLYVSTYCIFFSSRRTHKFARWGSTIIRQKGSVNS